jgi:Asp-tRNA(Asn)/Glu-tRNA(Gln) amidotransferase A subunit family amidase
MDHVGPLCRSVEDAAALYEAMRGSTPRAAAASPETPRALGALRLGVLRGYFTELLDRQVASAFEAACSRLRDAGVHVEDIDIAHASDIASVYVHIVLAEAAAYHARTLDSRPDDYTPNVRLRLEMGRYILAEDYLRALRGREVLRGEVDRALEARDALLLPALAVPATMLGATTVRVGSSDEPVRNITLRLTQLFNITGHAAIALPCGQTTDGLPIGVQLAAARTPELLQVAQALEPYVGPGMSR